MDYLEFKQVFGALVIAKLLSVPMVMAYHTHVPMYIPKYTSSWLVTPMWLVIKFLHRAADLTLVMSHALGKEMNAAGASTAEKIRIWQKGVDSDSFHPRFKSQEMHNHLTYIHLLFLLIFMILPMQERSYCLHPCNRPAIPEH